MERLSDFLVEGIKYICAAVGIKKRTSWVKGYNKNEEINPFQASAGRYSFCAGRLSDLYFPSLFSALFGDNPVRHMKFLALWKHFLKTLR